MATVIDLSGLTALVTGSNQKNAMGNRGGDRPGAARLEAARVVINHPDSPDGTTRR